MSDCAPCHGLLANAHHRLLCGTHSIAVLHTYNNVYSIYIREGNDELHRCIKAGNFLSSCSTM
jgi:hypothetical protein